MNKAYFIGIDIGTQGLRIVLLDETGFQITAQQEVFPLIESSREEQSPQMWWDGCCRLIPALINEIPDKKILNAIKAIAVTSTSGTIIPLDKEFNPLHTAIMYSDPRSADEATICREIATREVKKGYKAFNTSSGLPKMCWFLNKFPERVNQLYKFIHASDFITGRLCGQYGVTDYTNAMKSGYDIHNYIWPNYIEEKLNIRLEWLQDVRSSGEALGSILGALAIKWGLPKTVIVTTGMTDGCASQVASGAVSPGQWNTTIGTTLVIKGVTQCEVEDPSGTIYNHRHPTGYWMPGGASNTGADWASRLFAEEDLQDLARQAATHLPSNYLAWPLLQKGERFPFVAPHATGFWPELEDKPAMFAACMEGVAFIERYAYERIADLSGEKISRVFTAGGGSNSDTWLRIRSNVLNRSVCKMRNVSGAAGAAILAASRSYHSSLQEAANAMVHPEQTIEPEQRMVELYEQKYQLFIQELKSRKIL